VTPSAFLQRVFARHGLDATIVPNIVDLSRFHPLPRPPFGDAPHLVVTRNLEPIYDIPTALRAFAIVRNTFAQARLTVAGSGPELGRLQALAGGLGLGSCVHFCGRIDNAAMAALCVGRLYAEPEHGRQHADLDPGSFRQWGTGNQHRCGWYS
jgi:glycosyltransferase involved in cell wall biosynthesis